MHRLIYSRHVADFCRLPSCLCLHGRWPLLFSTYASYGLTVAVLTDNENISIDAQIYVIIIPYGCTFAWIADCGQTTENLRFYGTVTRARSKNSSETALKTQQDRPLGWVEAVTLQNAKQTPWHDICGFYLLVPVFHCTKTCPVW